MKKKEADKKKVISKETAVDLKEKVENQFKVEEQNKADEAEKESHKEAPAKRTLIEMVIDHIFGRKYYAVISYRIGTFMVGIHEPIFQTRSAAKKHLAENKTFKQLEIISFRSRNNYVTTTDSKGFSYTTIPNE